MWVVSENGRPQRKSSEERNGQLLISVFQAVALQLFDILEVQERGYGVHVPDDIGGYLTIWTLQGISESDIRETFQPNGPVSGQLRGKQARFLHSGLLRVAGGCCR